MTNITIINKIEDEATGKLKPTDEGMNMLKTLYSKAYKYTDNLYTAFCPYRICLLGAHCDHQKGKVLGIAINCGCWCTYASNKDRIITVKSVQYDGTVKFNISHPDYERSYTWTDYIIGAIKMLNEKGYTITRGITALIHGELKCGGVSSSSALAISFIEALAHVNGINIPALDIIDIIYKLENKYLGLSVGKMDPAMQVLAKKNKILVYDCNDDSYSYINNPNISKLKYVLTYSGVDRTLAGSEYNSAVDDCKTAAYIAYRLLNENISFNNCYLRNINRELVITEAVPPNFRSKARHFYEEQDRVNDAIYNLSFKDYDITEFGKLINESCKSSIVNYHCGSDNLNILHNIISTKDIVCGTRFMGAGYNGHCFAVINSNAPVNKIMAKYISEVHEQYLALFHTLKNKVYSILCESANGIRS